MSTEKTKADRIAKLLQLIASGESDLFYSYALAMEYIGLNQLNEAINLLKNIIASDKNYLAAYYQLSLIYQSLDDEDTALNYAKAGIEIADKTNAANKTKLEFKALVDELSL